MNNSKSNLTINKNLLKGYCCPILFDFNSENTKKCDALASKFSQEERIQFLRIFFKNKNSVSKRKERWQDKKCNKRMNVKNIQIHLSKIADLGGNF